LVTQLKGSKGKGAAAIKPPQFFEICEQVKQFVDQGDTIPVSALAKLVKFKLLMIKAKDLERREAEKKVLIIYAMTLNFFLRGK